MSQVTGFASRIFLSACGLQSFFWEFIRIKYLLLNIKGTMVPYTARLKQL